MTTHFPGDDSQDPLAARLRDALSSEASMVQPSDDGMQQIRDGISQADRPWWQHPAVLAVAAAVVLGAAVGAGVAFLGGDEKGNVVAGPSDSPTGSAGTGSPSDSPTSETSTPIPVEGDVYVYYVMDDGQGPRLYREQRPNPGMDPVTAALSTMLSEPPLDSDYSSAWEPNTAIRDFSVAGDTATVDLSRFVQVGAEFETAAMQQLVYTVTANDKSVKKVRLLVKGQPPASGHSDWSQPVARAPMLDVQGLIWLLTPTEGATVSSPVQIAGYGTAFEATISWQVYRDGAKVAEGFTQGGANGEFGEFADTVELEPGTYEMRAFESSAEDGSPLHPDTKTFTVE